MMMMMTIHMVLSDMAGYLITDLKHSTVRCPRAPVSFSAKLELVVLQA